MRMRKYLEQLNKGRGMRNMQQGTGGRGRQGGPSAAGPGGMCVCKSCDIEVEHKIGIPCNKQKCPKCGNVMARQ